MSVHVITLEEVRARGIAALSKELGVAGMIRFLQQFESGRGDYSKERDANLGDLSVDQIASEIQIGRQ